MVRPSGLRGCEASKKPAAGVLAWIRSAVAHAALLRAASTTLDERGVALRERRAAGEGMSSLAIAPCRMRGREERTGWRSQIWRHARTPRVMQLPRPGLHPLAGAAPREGKSRVSWRTLGLSANFSPWGSNSDSGGRGTCPGLGVAGAGLPSPSGTPWASVGITPSRAPRSTSGRCFLRA